MHTSKKGYLDIDTKVSNADMEEDSFDEVEHPDPLSTRELGKSLPDLTRSDLVGVSLRIVPRLN